MKKIEIKDQLGKVLFTHKCIDNTIKKTLEKAFVEYADLRDADLRYADLRAADLRAADLRDADLRYADLRAADLRYANLRAANLRYADLRDADLRYADLRAADLRAANLRDANLRDAKNTELVFAQTTVAPEGELIGWKKCQNNVIVKLLIPKEAKRSNATSRKCRAEYVEVLSIESATEKKPKEAVSKHDSSVIYRVGETVRCDKWDEDRWNECSGGIHFFITKEEALAW